MAGLIRNGPHGAAAPRGKLSAGLPQAAGPGLLDQRLLDAVPPFAGFHRPTQAQRKGP
jgi:hypothetical protein